jgi:hypothetical protein
MPSGFQAGRVWIFCKAKGNGRINRSLPFLRYSGRQDAWNDANSGILRRNGLALPNSMVDSTMELISGNAQAP